jgi:ligand-binding sensor domain-containing protein
MGRTLLLLLAALVIEIMECAPLSAAPYINSRSYTVEQGLPSNCVYGIVQDSIGFVWFGTSNGLCRFDSREFRTYQYSRQNRNSISSNSIRRIMIDSGGRIWISLDNGVDIYDPATDAFRHFDAVTEEGLGISGRTIEIIEDRDGEMWICTVDSGLFRYSLVEDKLTAYLHDPDTSISQNSISTVYESRDGTIWAGTYSEGLCAFSKTNGSFTRYKKGAVGNSISDNSVDAITEDSYGDLWLGLVSKGVDRLTSHIDRPQTLHAVRHFQERASVLLGIRMRKGIGQKLRNARIVGVLHKARQIRPAPRAKDEISGHFRLYFCLNSSFPAPSSEAKYFFQPGQKPICHRHNLPISDFGFLSYFARIGQFSQLCFSIIILYPYPDNQFVVICICRLSDCKYTANKLFLNLLSIISSNTV